MLQDVFYQTLGHEISHTLYRLPPEIYEIRHSREIKNHTGNFVAWINELYADFNSIKIIFDGNRSKGIECFCYKQERSVFSYNAAKKRCHNSDISLHNYH